MRRTIITFSLFICVLFTAVGQVDNPFTTVPTVNGKVIFEQFIPAGQHLTADQKYRLLQEWAKKTFAANPLLAGIRYDEKARTVTVSNRLELQHPEKLIMSYRFDATITNAGCMLVVRDIAYQAARKDAASFFPKVYTAELTITDQAMSQPGTDGEWRKEIRNETLQTLNRLLADLASIF